MRLKIQGFSMAPLTTFKALSTATSAHSNPHPTVKPPVSAKALKKFASRISILIYMWAPLGKSMEKLGLECQKWTHRKAIGQALISNAVQINNRKTELVKRQISKMKIKMKRTLDFLKSHHQALLKISNAN